jgi:hypothetical protein
MASLEASPTYTGLRYLGDDEVMSALIFYSFRGLRFTVLANADESEIPPGYDFGQSVEGKILTRLSDLTWGEDTEDKDERSRYLERELANLAANACLPIMQKLAPPADSPRPEPRTLQEYLYPETYALQILTEGDRLACRRLDGYRIPDKHPPIPEAKLQEIGLDSDTIPVPVVSLPRSF